MRAVNTSVCLRPGLCPGPRPLGELTAPTGGAYSAASDLRAARSLVVTFAEVL